MQPRPYQSQIIQSVEAGWKDYRKQLVVLATGGGKTPVFSWLAQRIQPERTLILAHREELIDQAIDKLRQATGIRADKEKAEHRASLSAPVVVASVQSMQGDRLQRWPANHFGLVVADEAHHCFPFETPVLTDLGLIPIGEIVERKLKVKALSVNLHDHSTVFKPVTNWFSNGPNRLLRITHEFGSFTCTGNHKIWTQGGYARAEDLVSGMRLRVLQKGISPNGSLLLSQKILQSELHIKGCDFSPRNSRTSLGKEQKTARIKNLLSVLKRFLSQISGGDFSKKKVLFSQVCTEMEPLNSRSKREITDKHQKNAQINDWQNSSRHCGTIAVEESNEGPCGSGENESQNERAHFSRQGRKRATYQSTDCTPRSIRLADGICDTDQSSEWKVPITSQLLQSGSGLSGDKAGHRSRWKDSQTEEVEVPRQKENGNPQFSRVVSVEVYERGSERGSVRSGSEDLRLYDIEVADNHNYFANGVLVSNSISDSWQKVLRYFDPHSKVIGVTATSDRGDSRNLGEYYESVAAEIGLFDLIKQGYLSRVVIKSIPLEISLSNVGQSKGDYDVNDLDDALTPYLGAVAQAIAEHAPFRKTLVFVPLIATSKKMVEACQSVGLQAMHVDGYCDDRKQRLHDFATGKFDVASNSSLLGEGYDDPSINCIVILRATRSRPLYSQFVGRGTRLFPMKDNLLLLDFLWMHTKHNLVRPAHLIAKTQEEAEVITKIAEEESKPGGQGELDLEGLASAATEQRHEALRKKLEANRTKKGKLIDAMEYAMREGKADLVDYEPVMKWESQPVTEKQFKALKRNGIDPASVNSKGHAMKLLQVAYSKQPLLLASEGQRRVMRRAGCENWENATAEEARRFFAGLRRKAA